MKYKKVIILFTLAVMLILAPLSNSAEARVMGQVENYHHKIYYGYGPYWGPKFGEVSKYLSVAHGYRKTGYNKIRLNQLGPLTFKYRFVAKYRVW
ncbi:hypothetical protein HB912_13040 [Listeria aquatica]|uniref:Lactococcin 972 family bacteriocin n=1 Tax=Listeria aquatica TaxID=1494960 RepID=A0A841ZPZ9_9LIST|nr:hypothetical protein [Listeria aquatica]MBC1522576.1 hypothetical protein [Listeria aquatica]